MKLSANTRYAARILFELHHLSEPVSTAWIAEKTGLTVRTAENIHSVLKQAGITSGIVGAKGGISLERSLDDISLGELIELFDAGIAFSVCCGDKANECPNQGECGIRSAWDMVSRAVQEQLDAVSLASILRRYPRNPEGNGFALNRLEGVDL